MPTVLFINGFRFFFYSNEGAEPPHIHVEKGGAAGKWWISPISLAWQDGFTRTQLRAIDTILQEHTAELREA